MTVAEAVRACKLRLDDVCPEESLREAQILLGYVLGIDEKALPLHHQMALSREQIIELGALLERRAGREPLQYILGQWEFMGLPIITDARALIPRPDTETLVEAALRLARERGYRTALDLCCGSGCIGVSLAALGGLQVLAADISRGCLELTQENAALNGQTLRTLESDLFSAIDERFDMIVCNPPYLSRADMDALQPELAFEPREALYGGPDGLDFYRRIAWDCGRCLNDGGALLLEIGAAQAKEVCALFPGAELLPDAAGLPRVVCAQRP
ncbi:MAG: peptide chain release factor N(5)-glutamine methyltransferase [Clostridia bacterium]|nr:peptide chain release factor N(5)-glutamine methyltransferase [Clostridia bacterium]